MKFWYYDLVKHIIRLIVVLYVFILAVIFKEDTLSWLLLGMAIIQLLDTLSDILTKEHNKRQIKKFIKKLMEE